MKKTIRVCTGNGWKECSLYSLKKADKCEIISIRKNIKWGTSTTYTCFRPARKRGMNPVQYYRKYKCVPEKYTDVVNGRYYCNPAHCSRSWTSKEERDKHLDIVYGALD